MRYALAIALCAACGVKLAIAPDARPPQRDAVVDVDARAPDAPPPDARPCTGGDARATGPGGQCFVLFTTPQTYAAAKAACAALPGHLALLEDAATDTFAEPLVGSNDTFVGATDLAVEGSFVWDDGTPVGYTHWRTGEPNNGAGMYQEDCVVIAGARTGGGWDDRPCDGSEVATAGSYAYLCEY